MTKLFAATAALTLLFVVQAQAQGRQQEQDACGRDGTRLCKAVLNNGDMAILACLKQNRAKLRPACSEVSSGEGAALRPAKTPRRDVRGEARDVTSSGLSGERSTRPGTPRPALSLEHDPEKWIPVFLRDKREAFARGSCSIKNDRFTRPVCASRPGSSLRRGLPSPNVRSPTTAAPSRRPRRSRRRTRAPPSPLPSAST